MKKLALVKQILLVVIIIAAFSTGCKKYPDGPRISLASKKARVANTWVVEQYLIDGVDKTSSLPAGYTLEYTKEGKATYSAGGTSQTGTWEFDSNKDNIIFKGVGEFTAKILKLKSSSFWFSWEDATTKKQFELHLKSK